jgi:transposase
MNYSYFVGLDVGKKTFDASLMSLEEKELGHKTFANTTDGVKELLNWLSSYSLSLKNILFCAENMGCYVTDLSLASVELEFDLALACPLSIKKSIGLQRGKNDRIDAKRIANYTVLHHRKLKLYHLPNTDLVLLRSWMIIRENLVKQKVAAIKLHETVCDTTKLADMSYAVSFWEEHLKELKQKIKQIESQMEDIIASNISLSTNYKLLTSITGIGMMNAILLLCVTDNFERFSNPRKFACYCGVAPFEHTSGTSIRGKTRTSRLANKEVKVFLTRAAITAISWDPQMKSYYNRKTAEGKHKASVINAIRAKLIARCFAVIRRQTPFVTLVA